MITPFSTAYLSGGIIPVNGRGTKQRLFAAIRPPLLALAFVVKLVYIVLFAWWFNPWARRKANAALVGDIKAELDFVFAGLSSNYGHRR